MHAATSSPNTPSANISVRTPPITHAKNRVQAEPVSKLLIRYRHAAGLTQRQLAQAASVSVGTVRDLEQGLTKHPRRPTLGRLAAVLGFDSRQAEQLLGTAPRAARISSGQPGAWPGLRISLLGPVTARRDGVPIMLGSARQRAVMGMLALFANAELHREALIDVLWHGRPPTTAAASVQSYISRLRRLLAQDPRSRRSRQSLITSGASYQFRLAVHEADHLEFNHLIAIADRCRIKADLRLACRLYAQALALWQGDPLADLPVLSSVPAVIGLSYQRTDAVLRYADTAFAVGWHDQVLPHLRAVYHHDLLNERAVARLMIALAGSGQQAAALAVFSETRERLDDQLGVSPCAELSAAHTQVLRQELVSPSVLVP